ncbi:hypothetical protein GCM10010145_57840 [Streptomyces ruber]|uniref:Secreted protein n=2 Tax=Streptomyces TaxID=1883 RepID=A0A918BMJ2_9ACTN|nr:hypothetical protein [Streptomyces ruber]GGQ80537.1 hypothetical protein GCM10010145_57840 [Streptomyces ruber]
MRLFHSLAPVFAATVLLLTLPYEAVPHARAGEDGPQVTREPSGAECRTGVHGSRVVAHCHNPYPDADQVRLHVECARWWDLDTDGPPVVADPARTVRLTGRCWQEIGSAWVSHGR